jgi:hypothetical protein
MIMSMGLDYVSELRQPTGLLSIRVKLIVLIRVSDMLIVTRLMDNITSFMEPEYSGYSQERPTSSYLDYTESSPRFHNIFPQNQSYYYHPTINAYVFQMAFSLSLLM